MARAFVARADGRFMCALEPEERSVIRQVSDEVTQLIGMGLGGMERPGESTGSDAGSEDPLTRLAAELGEDQEVRAPIDPALARLLPPASQDGDAADEFRRLAQRGIAEGHIENLSTMQAGLEAASDLVDVGSTEVIIARDESLAWLKGLTAIRLVLGERMGLRGDSDFDALQALCEGGVNVEEDREPGTGGIEFLASLYEFLTWLQESLVGALNSRPH